MFKKYLTNISYFLILLFLVQEIYTKDISKLITGFSQSETDRKTSVKQPSLTRARLHRIRLYDRMKCFPRVLCTLTKADAFKQLGGVDLNGLADGYLTVLSAFPGGPDMKPQQGDVSSSKIYKHDMGEGNNNPNYNDGQDSQMDLLSSLLSAGQVSSDDTAYYDEEDDVDSRTQNKRQKNYKHRDSVATEEDEEETLLTDPLLHQKEKLEVQKLMAELVEEEREDAGINGGNDDEKQPSSSWTESALTLPLKIPMKIGGTIFKSFVIPYLLDRKKRDLSSRWSSDIGNIGISKDESRRVVPVSKRNLRSGAYKRLKGNQHEDPLKSAMELWKGLKDVKQCGALFPSCPFEAWEVVSMIKLVGETPRRKD